MTLAHRVEAVVDRDRSVSAAGLPFAPGDRVEVIVLGVAEAPASTPLERWRTLKGTVLKYDNPNEPVGVEDWDMLK